MSFVYNNEVKTQMNEFGDLNVAQPFTLFESYSEYGKDLEVWSEKFDSNSYGSTTHLPNEASIQMDLTTNSTAFCGRRTRNSPRYQPRKVHECVTTFNMKGNVVNTTKRVGAFDNKNGYYLELDGSDVYLVERTYISGTAVNTRISQSNWNENTLDGNGENGLNLDWTKTQLMKIDLQWLGVGDVRVYFYNNNGGWNLAHTFEHTNLLDTVYITTANLPITYEMFNTGVPASTPSMLQICSSIKSLGGYVEKGYFRACGRNITNLLTLNISDGLREVITFRLQNGYKTADFLPALYDVFTDGNDRFEFYVIQNPDFVNGTGQDPTTAGEWNAVSNSCVEVYMPLTVADSRQITTSVALSEPVGQVKTSGFVTDRLRQSSASIEMANPPSGWNYDRDDESQDILTIAIRSTTNGNSVGAKMQWREIR